MATRGRTAQDRAPRSAGPFAFAPFRWLLTARTIATLGNAAAPIALAFAVLDLTGSAVDLGIVVASRSLANVAVLLFGGVIADRLPKHLLLVGTSLAAAATQAVVAVLVLSGSATIPLLVVLSILNGAVAAVSFPASAAIVPQTVPVTELRPANALLRLSLNGGAILGASLGAILIAAVGPGWGLALNAASFALAGIVFAFVRTPNAQRTVATGAAAPPASVFRELREGWQEFSSRTWVWVVVAQFALVNAAFVGAIAVLGPLVADESFGRAAWGLIIAAETVGLALGGMLALRWRPRHALGIGVGLVAVTALPIVGLALVPLVPLLVIAFLIGGMAIEQFGVAWDQSLQQNIPQDKLARVYSYDAVGSFIAIPVGEILVGPLAHAWGTTPVLLGCAAVIVVASLAALSVRSVRRLTVGVPTADAAPAQAAGTDAAVPADPAPSQP
ncbi:MFS transporter [Cryobacterium sp. TMB1-7]|uniref:MFS transporter n=1 Tax=Cryobacterium sp. TMB1-7 TaxID=2555866 RepID=UPI00106A4C12|nr:MFS transporter [Cryobacterium sp. TMB1-7]TFC58210.1 MFS transporter [Cryobacterium sp. TMB1-7]